MFQDIDPDSYDLREVFKNIDMIINGGIAMKFLAENLVWMLLLCFGTCPPSPLSRCPLFMELKLHWYHNQVTVV